MVTVFSTTLYTCYEMKRTLGAAILSDKNDIHSTHVIHRICTLPNVISLIRLLLIPVFFVVFVIYEDSLMGFIIFAIAASTDWVDGQIARKTDTVSALGQLLDPFVDRFLIAVGVVALFIVGRLPLWIVLVLLLRDGVLLGLTIYMKRKTDQKLEVIFLGKLTTACLMIGFASLVLNWPPVGGINLVDVSFLPGMGSSSAPFGIWFIYFGIIVSWITAFIYLYRGMKIASSTNTTT